MKTGIQVGGTKPNAQTQRVISILEKALMRAVELGRSDVALKAIEGLSEYGGAKYTTITGCSFQGK